MKNSTPKATANLAQPGKEPEMVKKNPASGAEVVQGLNELRTELTDKGNEMSAEFKNREQKKSVEKAKAGKDNTDMCNENLENKLSVRAEAPQITKGNAMSNFEFKKNAEEKATMSQKEVKMVNQNIPLEAKVVFKKINELHPNQEFTKFDEEICTLATAMINANMFFPIVIDNENNIIVGNSRFFAVKKLNFPEIPTLRVDELNDPAIVNFSSLAINTTAKLGFNEEFLNLELNEFLSLGL